MPIPTDVLIMIGFIIAAPIAVNLACNKLGIPVAMGTLSR